MNETFFSFRHFENSGKQIMLSCDCNILGEMARFAASYLNNAKKEFSNSGKKMNIILNMQIPEDIKNRLGDVYYEHSESYCILVDLEQGNVYLYAPSSRGLIYAVSTLIQLVRSNNLTENLFLFDYPDKDIRGYRVYTPGRAYIPTFKAMVDKLLYYKYNLIIIEVGGAMEYKRHPEINEKWVEFCDEVSVSPDVSTRIQSHTYPWRKDSIHFDNGNGGFITQEEMRELVAYCRERELTVIPEVPSLSHSDYIIRAFPELNERVEDAYPDSYCPSNPKTYEVLFDIIDEVVDVFDPEYLNIGHDEYYTSAKCELCKHKNPVDIYVEDVTKIHDYLATKNIKAFMWADKFFGNMRLVNSKGQLAPCGGAAEPDKDVPALYECRGRIPTDITLLHWYWDLSSAEEEMLIHNLGYKMLLSNFSALKRKNYRELAHLYNGGFASNWGSSEEKYMQRNLQNFDLVNTAYVFWSATYSDKDAPALMEKVRTELYQNYKRALGDSVIEVCHTTSLNKPYKLFYDGVFIVDSDWLLGYHTVTYTDGTVAKLPVIYGYNIRCSEIAAEEDLNTSLRAERLEAVGASYPFVKDGKVWYKAVYANPYPEKKIDHIDACDKCVIL